MIVLDLFSNSSRDVAWQPILGKIGKMIFWTRWQNWEILANITTNMGRHKCEAVACVSSQLQCIFFFYWTVILFVLLWRIKCDMMWYDMIYDDMIRTWTTPFSGRWVQAERRATTWWRRRWAVWDGWSWCPCCPRSPESVPRAGRAPDARRCTPAAETRQRQRPQVIISHTHPVAHRRFTVIIPPSHSCLLCLQWMSGVV